MAGNNIRIRGDGVAARCCAHLLTQAGLGVFLEASDRPRVPAIMLSESALGLVRDVFSKPLLFSAASRIDRRVVSWGGRAAPAIVPHNGVVVSETALLRELGAVPSTDGIQEAAFTIYTARPLPDVVQVNRFGSRRAVAAQVKLRDAADLSACLIEACSGGWLFLIPNAVEETWLLAVGASLEELLADSRLVAPRIVLQETRSGAFDACPRLAAPVCGADWLACGTEAMAFDPICGDGTAQAVREAILASAVIVAMEKGGDAEAEALRVHYDTVLTAAMRRHLVLCSDYYNSGGTGPWWQGELKALLKGHEWCTSKMTTATEAKYQLRGFELVRRDAAK